MTNVDEPLHLSAPLAWRLAPRLCRKDPATGEDCSSMHGTWQYLRILRLVGTIEYRADFYWRAVGAFTGVAGAPRVLLSGAADYAMLAHVLAAFRERGLEPDITVVDLCETPLALNRWYAERAACKIVTQCCDILEYTATAAFDAICTDSFVGRFPHTQWPELFARWHVLLRPGGLVITDNRLRPTSAGERVGFTAEQVQTFRAAVLRAAESMRESLAIDPHELARQAEIYARRHFAYAVRSPEEIREPLERSGFRVEQLLVATVAAGNRSGTGGPSVRGGGEFLRTVASRL